jgi:hypothetical protein
VSKTIVWQYNEFIQSRKEKLVRMLISEIIFLKTRFERANNKKEISYLKKALDKLEFLLIKLKIYSSDIPEEDFDKIIMLIYHTFKEVADNLDHDMRI